MTEIDYTTLTHAPRVTNLPAGKLTREEFEAECLAHSGGTLEQLREYHNIAPCDCGELDCPGWKATYLLKNKRARR